MKKSLIIIAMILLTCHPAYAGTMYTTEELNVRTAPGFEGEIVDVLDAGEAVEVIMTADRERSWAIVKHEDGLKAVCADYLTEKQPESPEPAKHLYGNCRITHYCPCARCCGKADGITASGVPATVGRTVANGSLPFGTRIQINGSEYVVEDRGVGDFTIDVFVAGHQEAWDMGEYYADVYIIED